MGIGNTYEECLALVVEALFPDAENPVIGSSKSFTKELVNSRNQNLWENFDSTCGIPFTLGDYIKQKKIPGTPKLYLYCYPNNSEDVVLPDIQKCDGVTTETVVGSSNLTDNDDDELPDINLTDNVNNFEDIFHEFVHISLHI
ncbi:hypothetical protein SNE40_006105 [Patella caerulea]|uniref:Uncharacterized protein n=1 Tax=Patella caerulea TaxID=87958 RepID=A0AAN8PVN3_PATCE